MLIKDKKHFKLGLTLLVFFFAVLYYMFTPSFNGQNAFHASDNLFNTIAKGSTNYFPQLRDMNKPFSGHKIDVTITLTDELSNKAQVMLSRIGVESQARGQELNVRGDLGRLIEQVLEDAQNMFANNDQAVKAKYTLNGKETLYIWWKLLKELDKELKLQKDFKAAKLISEVVKRGVEVGYNFYGIQARSAKEKAGVLTFALIFYVIYTLWFGYGIFFVFEGMGLEMSSGAKKEV
ncbi:hypothetical protein KFV02_08610 [Desulfohalobiaceae bacterium Ax17]|uniref:hypothetical protein n=1 Tax=Desulfovulcanus ferrireducens TaxID=2831190 RepID=UPI00207BB54C|nr:hypothetical protein [Desulfovulcanus ferrireducens]MBT8763989.1 hypothetical protein [Desulfovulcanus ferrireducens]